MNFVLDCAKAFFIFFLICISLHAVVIVGIAADSPPLFAVCSVGTSFSAVKRKLFHFLPTASNILVDVPANFNLLAPEFGI